MPPGTVAHKRAYGLRAVAGLLNEHRISHSVDYEEGVITMPSPNGMGCISIIATHSDFADARRAAEADPAMTAAGMCSDFMDARRAAEAQASQAAMAMTSEGFRASGAPR